MSIYYIVGVFGQSIKTTVFVFESIDILLTHRTPPSLPPTKAHGLLANSILSFNQQHKRKHYVRSWKLAAQILDNKKT